MFRPILCVLIFVGACSDESDEDFIPDAAQPSLRCGEGTMRRGDVCVVTDEELGDGDGDRDSDGADTGDGDATVDCSAFEVAPIGDAGVSALGRVPACEHFIACDAIAGPTLSMPWCRGSITAACIECLRGSCAEAGAAAGGQVDCAAAESCTGVCGALVQPPSTEEECLEIASQGNRSSEGDACFCSHCMVQLADCIGDPTKLCFGVLQCCDRHAQGSESCYTAPECAVVIDEAGVMSASVALAIEVNKCESSNVCGD